MIPKWLGGSLSMLLVLSLHSNQFYGAIPTSLCILQKIQLMDLSLNNISGNISKCLNNISGLTTMDRGTSQASIECNVIGLVQTRLAVRARVVFKLLLQWKGRKSEYQNTLRLVIALDLSSNKLSGEIPGEITSLLALVALNLSRNMLTGPIPQNIGRLRRLDFLDLSRNDLVGGIPTSLSQLRNLGLLDLSFNNLSGRITKSTQLQSFDVSSYTGNPAFCGVPILIVCPVDEPRSRNIDDAEQESNDDKLNKGFLVSVVVGFAFGFWGVCGPLFLNHSWRHAYYGFLNVIKGWVLVKLGRSFARPPQQTSP